VTTTIKKAKLVGFEQDKLKNYIVDLDNDLNHLFSQLKDFITLNRVQASSFITSDSSLGTSTLITLAKITALGSEGNLTFKQGILTNFVDPT
jgi:hypothetical protein